MDDLLPLLIEMADAADRISLPVWLAGDAEVIIKPDGSPVTPTDPAVEHELLALARAAHPDDAFLGEEVGPHAGRSTRRWIVDGIDGTSLFITERREWSTLIALADGDRPVAGMVTSPALGRRWYTTPTGGPWTVGTGEPATDDPGPSEAAPPEPLAVSSVEDPAQARIARWPAAGIVRPGFEERSERLEALLASRPPFDRPLDRTVPHGALLVADGRADAFVHLGGQAWDHAATAAIITAAGGRYSDLDGRPSIDGGAAIYSNGLVHDAVVEAMVC